jgi:hypothetical protein
MLFHHLETKTRESIKKRLSHLEVEQPSLLNNTD